MLVGENGVSGVSEMPDPENGVSGENKTVLVGESSILLGAL